MLQSFADWLTFTVFKLSEASLLGKAADFFIYDSIKIMLLLAVIIFAVTFIRSFLPPENVRKFLSRRNEYVGNFLAASFGIITPFCSCSAVPLFIGFVESGVPLGVTFSFLIAAPVINEVALALLWGMFGIKIALLYIASGLTIATVGGIIIGKLGLEKWVEDFVYQVKMGEVGEIERPNLKNRTADAVNYTWDLMKKVGPYVLAGVAIGGFIHGYAPQDFLARIAGQGNPFAVPIAVIIGIPLYANAGGAVPIVKVLIEKGLPMGTALAFMMAVTGLSLPEGVILRRVLKPKLLAVFFGTIGVAIIFTGYLFNLVL